LQNLLVYFCDCKKRKKETEPMCNCKKFALVIATRSYMCLKKGQMQKKIVAKKTVAKNTQVNASAKKNQFKKEKAP
jgi:hypothetical protein